MKRFRKASKPSRPGANTKDLKVVCGECSAPMVLKPSRYGLFWACTRWPECDGKHGAHPNGRPLGIPANKATKAARIRAHDAFDAYWKSQGWERSAAYRWLREQTGLSKVECHIGRFDIEQCELVVRIIEAASGAGPVGPGTVEGDGGDSVERVDHREAGLQGVDSPSRT